MIKEKKTSELNAHKFFNFDKESNIKEEKENNGQKKVIEERNAIFINGLNSDKDKLMIKQLLEEIESQSVFGVDLEYYQTEITEDITSDKSANNATVNTTTSTTPNTTENSDITQNISNSSNITTPSTANPPNGQIPAQKILGFVCTMQISTSSNDYILDCITLRDSIFDLLGVQLFMNYSKIKVMHGCDTDLKWLKQDFNIDVVTLFDTAKAHMLIHNQSVSQSLKNVVQLNLSIDMDKSYQLADWRIRPLPSQMISYAQMDSRILLEVFYCQVKQLEERQLLPQMQLACIRLVLKHTEPFYQNILTLVKDRDELLGQQQLEK